MTIEEKSLLIRDLCARLPYYTELYSNVSDGNWAILTPVVISNLMSATDKLVIKPYLRPMSSMTEKEKEEYCNLQAKFLYSSQYPVTDAYELFDWLNKNHFDFRGLIEKGLAIEVTEENNPYK
jgi:hypothetical protein